MLKILGAIMIIGGCGYAGLQAGGRYRRRSEMLRSLQNGLTLLENEISYTSTPLPPALARAGEKIPFAAAVLFQEAARLLNSNQGHTAAEAWRVGIARLQENAPTQAEETAVLEAFGQTLGCSAKREQLKHITLAREQLLFIEQQALEARGKYEKMWQYLGFCMGAVIVLTIL
ncbi:MAG: stage III sporulation protein SpoIIIAB [Clostridia bacterium]|nr:stage III sporulation protein SpoIIIAB [Clostridia bacterium]